MSAIDTNQVPGLPKGAVSSLIVSVPFLLLVVVGYLWLYRIWGAAPQWGLIGVGALGWMAALLLRGPVAPLAKKMDQARAARMMAGVAGPAEETVRLAVVLLVGRTFPVALNIGLGWAAIEILFAVVNGAIRLVLLTRTDEKALQARKIMEEQGMLKDMSGSRGVIMGVWERIFASALHIGFTLLLAANPWLYLITMPVHSAVDMLIPVLGKRLVLIEGVVTVFGTVVFLAGLLAFGKL